MNYAKIGQALGQALASGGGGGGNQQQQQQQGYGGGYGGYQSNPPPSYNPSSYYNNNNNNNNNYNQQQQSYHPSHGGGGMISTTSTTSTKPLEYVVLGQEMQLVEFDLQPGQIIIAEAGAMMYMEQNIEFTTKLGDGSEPKQGFFQQLFAAGGRWLTGESLFLTHFKNIGQTSSSCVAFAAPYPGTIVPVDLRRHNGSIICQKDAFLCAEIGTKVSIHFNKRIGSGLFGGEGFILQKLQGYGMSFIHAGGTVIEKELNHGDMIRLDTGCLVAFTEGIQYDIQFVKGLTSIIFGNEGLFLATLKGQGTVWMQSLPFSRMADRINSAVGTNQGEGTALTGNLGHMLAGDHSTGLGFSL